MIAAVLVNIIVNESKTSDRTDAKMSDSKVGDSRFTNILSAT